MGGPRTVSNFIMTRGELADEGPTYVSVAGVDGFYADALCDVFGASSVSAKAGEIQDQAH